MKRSEATTSSLDTVPESELSPSLEALLIDEGLPRTREPVTMIRALVVEDDPLQRVLIKELFEANNELPGAACTFSLTFCCTGTEAIQVLVGSRKRFDLMIIDVELPDSLQGPMLIPLIKSLVRDCPGIVMLSQHREPDVISACLRHGAGAYFNKPLRLNIIAQLYRFCSTAASTSWPKCTGSAPATPSLCADLGVRGICSPPSQHRQAVTRASSPVSTSAGSRLLPSRPRAPFRDEPWPADPTQTAAATAFGWIAGGRARRPSREARTQTSATASHASTQSFTSSTSPATSPPPDPAPACLPLLDLPAAVIYETALMLPPPPVLRNRTPSHSSSRRPMQSPRASKEEMGPLAHPTAASAEAPAAAQAAAVVVITDVIDAAASRSGHPTSSDATPAAPACPVIAIPDTDSTSTTTLRPTPRRPDALSAAAPKAKESETAEEEEMGACLQQ